MLRPDPNLAHLRAVAIALGDLREQLVFVGGSTASLLLTDPLAEGVRPTVEWMRSSMPPVSCSSIASNGSWRCAVSCAMSKAA